MNRLARSPVCDNVQYRLIKNMVIPKIQLPEDKIKDFSDRWKVRELALFGSVLRDDFHPNSDIDMLVTFNTDDDWSLFDHVQMQQELANILKRQVDLVSKRAIERSQNWIRRREILGQKLSISNNK